MHVLIIRTEYTILLNLYISLHLKLLKCVSRVYTIVSHVSEVYQVEGGFLWLLLGWYPHHYVLVVADKLLSTPLAEHASDWSNQHNNGPHQDHIFGNPSALHSIVGQNLDLAQGGGGGRRGGGGTKTSNRLFMKGVDSPSLAPPPPPSTHTHALSLVRFTMFKVIHI